VAATIPCQLESTCAPSEFSSNGRLPPDNALSDYSDIVLLDLKEPVALHLGAATLVEKPWDASTRMIFLVHWPDGKDAGIGIGRASKIRNYTRRWAHDVPSQGGSSGGGCFDLEFRLIGLHQGRWDNVRRLVPLDGMLERLREEVANDVAPPILWSLSGTLSGQLVMGRDGFFKALPEIHQGRSAKGLRVKRFDAEADLSGIPFTYLLLERMLARLPAPPQLLRISFETVVSDLPAEIVKRARLLGIEVADTPAEQGVAPDQTAPEAVESDRGRRVAQHLDTAAAADSRVLWIFIEHPSALFSEPVRYALEAFIDQALRLPSLRLLVAGYEAVALPGTEFNTIAEARQSSTPGFLTEYTGGFERQDLINLLTRAAQDLRLDVPANWAPGAAAGLLAGCQARLGRYPQENVADVVEKARVVLQGLPGLKDGSA
jgi:hypothetical protein